MADRRKNGRIDLEAVETLVRESMHHAGATALSHLLNEGPPESPAIPCSCGQSARYKELRSKPVLTVVGPVEYQRPYYVCPNAIALRIPRMRPWESSAKSSLRACDA